MKCMIKICFAKLFGNSGYGNKDSFEELDTKYEYISETQRETSGSLTGNRFNNRFIKLITLKKQ